MHSNGFVHCDIKPQNILINSDATKAVLCDFGLSSYAEDVTPHKPFQSLAYRAPEHIPERDMKMENYHTDFGLFQKIDYRLSELWSVGIICLEILYNTHGIVFSKAVSRCKLFPNSTTTTDHNYEKFINLLSMLHQPRKYESISGLDTYAIIKKIFGKVHASIDPLLKMVCDYFLPLELHKRSLHHFLYSSYFSERRLINERIPHVYPDVISMYVAPIDAEITKKATGILIDWLYGISEEYRMYPIVVMNAVDYIIQRSDMLSFFGVTMRNYQLFGASVFWIMCRLVNFDFFITLSDLKELCCDEYAIHEFSEMIRKMWIYEKGYFYFDCIYHYLPSEQLLEKAMWIQSDIEDYLVYPNPKKLALALLKSESVKDICNRTPKEFRDYIFFQKKKEEADSFFGTGSCNTISSEEIEIEETVQ
jgi:serine/threonine protein kinase